MSSLRRRRLSLIRVAEKEAASLASAQQHIPSFYSNHQLVPRLILAILEDCQIESTCQTQVDVVASFFPSSDILNQNFDRATRSGEECFQSHFKFPKTNRLFASASGGPGYHFEGDPPTTSDSFARHTSNFLSLGRSSGWLAGVGKCLLNDDFSCFYFSPSFATVQTAWVRALSV